MYITGPAIRSFSVLIALACTAQAYVIESLSFGHKTPISPNPNSIPGWQLLGEGHVPQVLSDRVILTPPAPGNKRGALWTDQDVIKPEWTADIDFRASGPDRGAGNLQIWFTKDGSANIGHSSLYTVGTFDGLVLVLDQYGGKAGSIRGFLNDGTVDYKQLRNVDSLAFGHCDYAYRNLGRWSHIQVQQGSESFQVQVDGQHCFKSDKVKLPVGYHFGISAASAETPDSFEVNKFAVSTTNSFTREEVPRRAQQVPPQQQHQQQQIRDQVEMDKIPDRMDDKPASAYSSSDAQFYDLHNRLQLATHQINNIFREVQSLGKYLEERHNDLASRAMPHIPYDQISAMDVRIQTIENVVRAIQKDVEGKDYREHLTSLQAALKDTQTSLTDALPQTLSQIVSTSRPKMGLVIFAFIAFQLLLAGSYIVYKRRRANAPKKFL